MEKFKYRLSSVKKAEIAQNLIDVLECNVPIEKATVSFVSNWILTGPDEKGKAFYDVWDLVLKNYMPTTRPILFRSCSRRTDGKIASFTGRLECARRFGGNRGFLLMCDTTEGLKLDMLFAKRGEYRNTFYPLSELIKRDIEAENHVFSDGMRRGYVGEDEYIMRVNLWRMCTFKWYKERGANA